MNQASLAQRLRVGLLDRGDQAGGAVADDQQWGGQAAVFQISQEGCPGVGGLAGAGGQADERGLAAGGDAPGGEHGLGRGAGRDRGTGPAVDLTVTSRYPFRDPGRASPLAAARW